MKYEPDVVQSAINALSIIPTETTPLDRVVIDCLKDYKGMIEKDTDWVPVNHKSQHPSEGQKVFVTLLYVDGDRRVEKATYTDGEFMKDKYISFGHLVTAWRPYWSPEPYREEEAD